MAIDPKLLGDDNPTGSPIRITGQPAGVRSISKAGIGLGGAAVATALLVAILGFGDDKKNGPGNGPDAQPQKVQAPKEHKPWYANVPDTPAPAPASRPAADSATDRSISAPAEPAPAQTEERLVPPKPMQMNQSGSPADQDALREHDALVQAQTAALSASGFSESSQQATATAQPVKTASPSPVQPPLQRSSEDPSLWADKDRFLAQAAVADSDYNPSVRTQALSPYEVKAGTVIPAILINGANSDLPGQLIAQVRENVYDTVSGRFLLIPQGTRLVGKYDSHVAYGQTRVLVAWQRLIFADGSNVDLHGMPGGDVSGYAGFEDEVDNHYFRIFGAAILMSAITAGVEISQPASSPTTTNPSVGQTATAALGQNMGQAGSALVQKNLSIQPTLTIRPGYLFNVMVTADLILPKDAVRRGAPS